MKFAFTGPAQVDGRHYERKYLIALACENGHQIQKRVDHSTDYLVVNTSNFFLGSSIGAPILKKPLTVKMQRATYNETPVITPRTFLQMMGYLEDGK
jgi:hypothetical protein